MKQKDAGSDPADIQFFTIPEIAKKQRVSPRHVFREIQAGKLRAHRFGKTTRISLQDFRDYLAASQTVRLKPVKSHTASLRRKNQSNQSEDSS